MLSPEARLDRTIVFRLRAFAADLDAAAGDGYIRIDLPQYCCNAEYPAHVAPPADYTSRRNCCFAPLLTLGAFLNSNIRW
jgi:hypothetical protein